VVGRGVFAGVEFLNECALKERLDGTIEGARAKPRSATGLLSDLTHDRITVEIFASKGEKNLEGGGGEWIEFLFWQDR
jgi:hypothetical protein